MCSVQEDNINTYHARMRLKMTDQVQVPVCVIGLVLAYIQVRILSSITAHFSGEVDSSHSSHLCSSWQADPWTTVTYLSGLLYHYYKFSVRPQRRRDSMGGGPCKDCYVSTHIALQNPKVINDVKREYITRTTVLMLLFLHHTLRWVVRVTYQSIVVQCM